MNVPSLASSIGSHAIYLALVVAAIYGSISRTTLAAPIYAGPERFIERTHDKQYFRFHFPYAGGVVPWGKAAFFSSANMTIKPSQLELVILDRSKLTNGRPDYDSIGIRWNNNSYVFTVDDDILLPLMQFVNRGHYIAYTLPEKENPDYLSKNGLVQSSVHRDTYVAREFIASRHQEFLNDVDFLGDGEAVFDETDALPEEIENAILEDFNRPGDTMGKAGTYVNADFNVRYRVYLRKTNNQRTVDVAGLPLRYYWSYSTAGSAVITNVRILKFPKEKYSLPWRTVVFFQAAAILRQIKQDNRAEFNRFLTEVHTVMRR